MYESVSQPIDVLASFKKERVEPVIFKLANRYYHVKRVNLVHSERRGREKITFFSVSDESNAYRLSFSSETLKWMLEESATL